MNKNYQKVLDETIKKIQLNNEVPTLLIHSCCAPCSSYVLEYLREYFDITVFFYNPNISNAVEYEKRLQEENKSLQMLTCANCGEQFLTPDGAELYEKNVQLKQENEELKARLQTLNDEILTVEITTEEFENYKKLKQENEELKARRIKSLGFICDCEENVRYRQALEEIREKAQKHIKAEQICFADEIINLINEVLNDANSF